MKTFRYKARSRQGANVDGVLEANTRDEAVSQLIAEGLIVSSIEETGGITDINLSIKGRKAKSKALSVMCKQFSIITRAGIPIVHALRLVADQSADKGLRRVLSEVADDVAAGYPLADSFDKHSNVLPETFIETVRAGEASGNLDVCFERLSEFYERAAKNRSKVINAMVYPIFVLIVAVVVVLVLMVFAIPTFSSSFASMGQELPALTQAMIACSDFLIHYWWILVIAIVSFVAVWKLLKRHNENFRLWVAKMATRIPVLGKINLNSATSQYAGTMSVMMQAGLAVTQAVDVTAKSITNYYMGQALSSIRGDLEAGKPLGESLGKTGVYPPLVIEMTTVGEETGSLENTLDVMATYYDNEVSNATERALSLMEPLTIVLLGGIVAVIMLAVYLPMFTLETSVG
jgi:type IV pilus assembly protein PilC